ncbi:MAG: 23S rRNA (guanosine(2251)-2'-O)-methyltransferase RlmB [Gammaproteobacteria bacterium]|nr:MAG: 23S rRNA (guanosine(2251)-2'-O)-methyltransferase RlmB [Gammaproteobacteria bacterium]RLA32992.1 MAG: 23S rRNA (guanosine(2251)-2'-O)-methyltransferase RlmB [Gammaproteobacteria bacterium]
MSKARYVTGLRAVEQLLAQPAAEITRLYAEYQTANPRVESIISQANSRGIEIQAANRARLQQISGETRHQGVVAEIRRSQILDEGALRSLVEKKLTDGDGQPLLLLVLDGIQDPHNLGACLRTADAAGVDAVIVPRHGAASLGPTVSKVAAGAAETMPFASVANIGKVLAWLVEYGVTAVGTSDAADGTIFDCDLVRPLALVMGREHSGLRKNVARRCDELVSLPMQGAVSSLNVSVATGICLYEALRQRESAD